MIVLQICNKKYASIFTKILLHFTAFSQCTTVNAFYLFTTYRWA
jgi:hypothetical protein